MLELFGHVRLKEQKTERNINNNRVIKTFKGYSTYKNKSIDKKNYISFYITIFGDQNNTIWNRLTGNWIYGRFKITGMGDKVIFAETDLRDIGLVMNTSTNVTQEKQEKDLGLEDVNLSKETIDYIDSALDLNDL